MAHWYQPKEMMKEWQAKRKAKKDSCKGSWLYSYPVDRFYTPINPFFDLLIVDKEHELVKLNLGRVGDIKYRLDKNGGIIDPRDTVTPAKATVREWPYGGVSGPGFKFAITPFWMSKLAVVFTGQRVERFHKQDVITADPFTLPDVDAQLTYRVIDPLKALTVPQKGDFQTIVREMVASRLTDFVNNHSLDELMFATGPKTNYAWIAQGQPQPLEIDRIGVIVDGIRISELKTTETIDKIILERTAAKYKAQAIKTIAQANLDAAQANFAVGQLYDHSQGMRAEQISRRAAESQNSNVTYNEGEVKKAEALEKLVDVAKKIAERLIAP